MKIGFPGPAISNIFVMLNIKSVDLEVIIKLDKLVRLQMVINGKTVFEGDLWLDL
jgi:hypothetical protein